MQVVCLVFTSNNCYTKVLEGSDPQVAAAGVIIDLEEGQWFSPFSPGRSIKIGSCRKVTLSTKSGVIGVFDPQSLEHLNTMLRASQDVTNSLSYIDMD